MNDVLVICEYFYQTENESSPSCHYFAHGPDDCPPCGYSSCEEALKVAALDEEEM